MIKTRREGEGGPVRLARVSFVLGLGGLGLAACATAPERPGLASTTPGPQARADQHQPGAPPQAPFGLHGTDKPYQINGIWYYPKADPNYDETGYASWYGQAFHNKHTADGEVFDQYALSAAHKTLPLPSIVEVTNLDNGRTLRLRLNDRGPFVDGRLLDVSKAAAEQLGFGRQGLAHVRVRYVGPAPAFYITPMMYASTDPELIGDRRSVSFERDPDAPLPTVAKEPAAHIDAKPLPPTAAPKAPPPSPLIMAANDGHRFTEASIALSAGALAPVTAATAAPTVAAPAVTAPAPQPPAMVDQGAETPVPVARAASAKPLEAVRPDTPPSPSAQPPAAIAAAPNAGFAVQAGAFANRANAERVAAQLGATIRPIDRNGVTLYRVVLTGYADASAAETARARAAAAGFPTARIVAAN